MCSIAELCVLKSAIVGVFDVCIIFWLTFCHNSCIIKIVIAFLSVIKTHLKSIPDRRKSAQIYADINHMKFEILLSCMNQNGDDIIERSNIASDTLIVNQCEAENYQEQKLGGKTIRIFSVTGKGLTKSRNFAIKHSDADICLLCDDDEVFKNGCEDAILKAYDEISDADVIAFNIGNRPAKFPDKIRKLNYFDLMKISSWQISFKRQSLNDSGIAFDENMGAGSGNGAEEEFKFLTDCRKAGLKIYYYPYAIADVAQTQSTWFHGFDEAFFINRGNTTRYIMGFFPALLYALYYTFAKRQMIKPYMNWTKAFWTTCRGIFENRLSKLKKKKNENK